MIVRLLRFLALRALLLIASRMEVSPIPVRALASSGDTASRSESGRHLSFLPELVHHISPLSFARHNGVVSLVALVLDLRSQRRR